MTQLTLPALQSPETAIRKNAFVGEQLRRPAVLAVLVGAVSFLLYCGTLAFKFVYDDKLQVIDNVAITGWRYVPQYFSNSVWALIDPHIASNYYRPIFLLWLKINYSLFGLAPAGWHALCVLLHVLATVQTFWLARRLLRAEVPAALAALLFAVHPVHIESVAWVSGATDPLVTVFTLGAVLGFLRFLDHHGEGSGWLIYAASMVSAALALLSKEIAIVLPVLLIATASVTRDQHGHLSIRKYALPFFALIPAYVIVRYFTLHGFSHALGEHPTYSLLLTWPSVLAFYARQLVAPFWISPQANIFWVTSPNLRQFWIPVAACVVLVATAVIAYLRSKNRGLVLALYGWILLPLLPVLYLTVLASQEIVHDRYLYLPSVGFSILVVMAGLRAVEQFSLPPIKVPVAIAMASLAFLTFKGELDWASDLLLFTRAVSVAPENDSAVMNLGLIYIEQNRLKEGSELLRRVCERDPNFALADYNLGRVLYLGHRDGEAEWLLRRAVTLEPLQEYWLMQYAGVELRLGKVKEAERAARQALGIRPDGPDFHLILGAILAAQGNRADAEKAYREELRFHPDNLKAQQALKVLNVAN
jgi:Tfp pilus assembly protein PilF